ncbi:hypothetical protein L9F63_024305, partial [Diploptera punctata]
DFFSQISNSRLFNAQGIRLSVSMSSSEEQHKCKHGEGEFIDSTVYLKCKERPGVASL